MAPALQSVNLHLDLLLVLLLVLVLVLDLLLLGLFGSCLRKHRTTIADGLARDIRRDAISMEDYPSTGTALGLIVEDVATARIERFDLHAIKATANPGCRVVARSQAKIREIPVHVHLLKRLYNT
jgi:hypothetical protein